MLPGDFIAQRLTGTITTTPSALSEGIFWNFTTNETGEDILSYFGFDNSLILEVKNVFTEHGKLSAQAANELSLKEGIPVSYKAGDQPNNALSLNVFHPGEVAAGLDIMRENGMTPTVIRAGKANMFLSRVFCDAFVNAISTPVELYNTDGSVGAGIGVGFYGSASEAFRNR